MMKKLLLVLSLLIFCANLFAQDLYMPRNVRAAYKNGTRSADGKPGAKYWQNSADYDIKLNVNPTTRLVSGTEDIIYRNNSPQILEILLIRLTMNTHRPTAAREGTVAEGYISTGITIDEYKENGKTQKWKAETGTSQYVRLEKKLKPGESVKLSFAWHYELSKESGREGATDASSFFIAYFYPQIAVLDDIDGWDNTPFTEGHEFYNDFNNYIFEVNAPKNFVVWATGDLQNIDETLQPKFASRLKESFTSDKIINVASLDELKSNTVTTQKDIVSWRWKADKITDIAISMSDHYIWDAGSVIVDKSTGRRASVQAAYNVEAKDFQKMVEYSKNALDWCSNNYPGTPYPFSKTTVFRGVADMEYPMMVNDSSFENPDFARFVVEHEILHSWFPFYMGINETRYGFMDEGWTTAFENLIAKQSLGEDTANTFFKQFRVQGWTQDSSYSSDIPIITPGDSLVGNALGNNQYGKAAVAYLALKDMVGDEVFKKSLHEFMNRWNGKHPLPWDMFNSFNNASGKDYNWFFQNWFFTNNYIDLALENVTNTEKGFSLTIKNIGGFAVPVDMVVTLEDGTIAKVHQTPEIWSRNQKSATLNIASPKKAKTISLDGGIYMDADETNNRWDQK
jgi:hypothetical protein